MERTTAKCTEKLGILTSTPTGIDCTIVLLNTRAAPPFQRMVSAALHSHDANEGRASLGDLPNSDTGQRNETSTYRFCCSVESVLGPPKLTAHHSVPGAAKGL